ncbi:uncharacterized protein LOC115239391 isoform X1 [Formica exsecta]|uniref:uncharacterized protein LOC115239391 isoform X1 n=2 Tax=Formica exsecta TaxID=72781 RepID=UPI001141184B|nr:uncharacterized protein LOC115239391 isoform X1 [Formica exsecta]
MARVLLYERVVDAVLTHANSSHDSEIQDGMKIKDEPDDMTLNTDTRDALIRNLSNLKNDTLNRNCSNMINHDEASLLENDIAPKTVKSRKSKRISNSHSAYVGDADKTFNLKRKRATVKTEKVRDALPKKKQKRSNNFQISKNKNINTFTKTTDKFNTKRKQQSITSDSRTKKQRTTRRKETATKCNICFRTFSSFRNCETHKQSYIGDYQCKNCKMHYMTHKKFYLHTIKCYRATKCYNVNCRSRVFCNFCHRPFKKKALLQSHLFHLHRELIYSSNVTKRENPKSKNENLFRKNDTLKTDAHEESPCLSNLIKSKKRNIILINNKSPSDDDVTKTENLRTEESFSDGMSPMKKLRQPTLTEYLELCKRKRDINTSPNKSNIIKDSFPSALFHDEKRINNPKSNFSEMYNEQVDSLSTKSSNLEQMAHSTLEQNRNHEVSKKPFVKLHADVEMMKSFLEKLPNTIIEDKVTKDQRNDIISYYQEVPYSLRSLRTISSAGTVSSLRKRKSKESEKSQFNTKRSTKTEHNVTNLNKIDSNFWKTAMVRFNCKDCRIILTRCDENIINYHQIPAIKTTFKENISFSPQCNSMLFQENDVRNEMVLKKLEVSLERLTTVSAVDITKMKTVSDTEKCNDGSFLCKVCKKSFSSKLDKHMHIKSSHIAYMSSICDARYKLKHKLLQHYLSEHLSKQNQCCVCYTVLSSYVELKRHLNVHCLKYVQKENDQCPIDIEVKCSSIKNNYKCLQCSTVFLTQTSLMIHQSFCILQEEMTTDQEDSMKRIDELPKIILKVQRSNNANGLTVICDEKTHSDDECLNKNSAEMTNEHRISPISEEDPKVIKETEINENEQNSSVNNNLVTKEIGIVNESQNSEKLLENSNSTISNQDIANAQLDVIKPRIDIYPCDICGRQFHSHKNLQQHIRTFNYTTDVCPICGTAFSSKRLLQTHITAAHVPQISKTYSFHCVFCNQGFFKKYELRPHILHLHGQQILDTLTHDSRTNEEISDTQTTMCNVCDLVFETHDRYMEHRMYYYKNHTFTCSLCAQKFQGMYMLNHHNKLTHYSEDKRKSYNYICNICNEGFNHEKHFHSHNMHVHSNEENLTEIVKESEERSQFDHASEAQEHIRNCSTNQQKEIEQSPNEYTCHICQLKCIDSDDMAKHTAFYSNDGDFRCDRCKRQCRTFKLLYEHRQLTHFCRDTYNGYACRICGEVLETIISLKCHKKHFHSNDTVYDDAYDRKDCEQTLSLNTASKVIEHKFKSNNTHNTAKCRYNCLFCDMKFFSANAIQTHILQTHFDDLAAKRIALKSPFFIIEGDNIRKHSVQQLVEANQASTSAVTLSSTATTRTLTPAAATRTLTSATAITTSATTITASASPAATTKSISAATTTISTSATAAAATTTISTSATAVAATLEDNSTQFFQDKISNILDKKEIKDKTDIVLPNQIKAILLENNKIMQKIPAMPSISGFKTNIAASVAIALSNQFNANGSKVKVLVPVSIESTNDPQKDYTNSLKSASINEVNTNLILSSNKSTDKFKDSVIQSTASLKTVVIVPQAWKSNETTNQKSEPIRSYNCNSNYTCPLCPLEYPSLMFFHAHLRYAHAESIQTDMINSQLNGSAQEDLLIKCLLCLCKFTDEDKYKSHLKNHTDYVCMSNSKNVEKTDEKKKSTTPEVITVDDDDDVENSLNQRTVEATATLAHGKQNEKIGKLRVKPFAKIMENLSMEYALKHLQSKQVSHSS